MRGGKRHDGNSWKRWLKNSRRSRLLAEPLYTTAKRRGTNGDGDEGREGAADNLARTLFSLDLGSTKAPNELKTASSRLLPASHPPRSSATVHSYQKRVNRRKFRAVRRRLHARRFSRYIYICTVLNFK